MNRVLGPGFLEKVYENALLIELRSRGYKAESQVPIRVYYKEDVVGEYIADILVEGTVIVEIKTVEKLEKLHEAQLLNYLKGTGIQVGLLFNMKSQTVDIGDWIWICPKGMRKSICVNRRESAVSS